MLEVRTVTTDEVVKELLNLVREMRDSDGDKWARRVKNIADSIRKTERLEAEVAGWWNGCTLHCPKVLKLRGE